MKHLPLHLLLYRFNKYLRLIKTIINMKKNKLLVLVLIVAFSTIATTGYSQIRFGLRGEVGLNKATFSPEALEAEKRAEEEAKNKETKGQAIVDYACQFIGNPYVWGGTSLTNGADCSGFVQSVFAHFGISLPRTSGEMRSSGTEVSYDEAIAGDIICYDGHVGIYMGDGQIVNAINSDRGIGVLSATYSGIITVRRLI